MTDLVFNVPVNPLIVPRWYQSESVISVMDFFMRREQGNPIIALPTGTGKSLVQAMIIAYCMGHWPRTRFLCLTHVKELIAQNVADCIEFWPTSPVGIFSAGLDEKTAHTPIVFGGVQSVVNAINLFGWRDVILIDECHLMNSKDESMYGKVISELRKLNSHLKVIGLSATPYRTGQGLLTDGGLFTHIVYDMTTMEMFNRLIVEGFMSPLVTKPTDSHYRYQPVTIDTSQLKIRGDDFKLEDIQAVSDIEAINEAVVNETCFWGRDRGTWLTFASGVKHASHLNEKYRRCGIESVDVYDGIGEKERDRRFRDYKSGYIRNLVVFNMGGIGFNHPPIDLISDVRVRGSVNSWVQAMGRGTRPSPRTFKKNCLGLDFGGNTKRLGPINDPLIPKKRGTRTTPGIAPVKICPVCGFYNHTRATVCCNAPECTHVFPQHTQLQMTASVDDLLRIKETHVETADVLYVTYSKGKFLHTRPYFAVSYHCGLSGMTHYMERIWIENDGDSRSYAIGWWRKRYCGESLLVRAESYANYVPKTVDEALRLTQNLKTPRTIRIDLAEKEPKIIGHDF